MLTTEPDYMQNAITAARRLRALHRQHFAVVQREDKLVVRDLCRVKDKRIAWSTKDDCRKAGEPTDLTQEDYDIIRQLYCGGMVSAEIAEKFEISVPRVNRIAGTRPF